MVLGLCWYYTNSTLVLCRTVLGPCRYSAETHDTAFAQNDTILSLCRHCHAAALAPERQPHPQKRVLRVPCCCERWALDSGGKTSGGDNRASEGRHEGWPTLPQLV